MEHMDVFRQNYLVSGLDDPTIDAIAALGEYKVCLARESLITLNANDSDLYVILEGTVHIYSPTGEKLAEVGPPAVIGEVALVDNQPRSAYATAITLVKYVRLPANELRKFMWEHKEAGFIMLANLTRVLSMRLRQSNVTVEALRGKAQDPWKLAL